MLHRIKMITLAGAALFAPGLLNAQFDFNVDGHQVQIHSFGSQGFFDSNDNNFATMKTSQGSFGFTDAGVNIGTNITDHFHIGAQMYVRHLGALDDGTPRLDWAVADYKFKDWFGIRAGKVKTALGLYNDTQDLDFLNTWALLPQGIYPIDVRSATIAHEGVDIYGTIAPKRFGSLAYTLYTGLIPNDPSYGYVYGLRSLGIDLESWSGKSWGGDLRWSTPLPGFMLGASLLDQRPHGDYPSAGIIIDYHTQENQTTQFYAQYLFRGLHVDGEWRRGYRDAIAGARDIVYNGESFYLAAAYRVSKWVELGSYDSHYYANTRVPLSPPSNHIFDKVATARVDMNSHVYLKVEGHFMNGYAASNNAHGFYAQTNPHGLQPKTDMLVVRTGFDF
jgi:hypothetical protein